MEHQGPQMCKQPDDFIEPGALNPLTRHYLREAFRYIARVQ
jgi:hypothetical protein